MEELHHYNDTGEIVIPKDFLNTDLDMTFLDMWDTGSQWMQEKLDHRQVLQRYRGRSLSQGLPQHRPRRDLQHQGDDQQGQQADH